MPSVLLLNADAAPLSLLPLSTISWQSAVKTIFGDKVHVIKNYEGRFIRSTSLSIPMPSVVMLTKYHKQPTKAKYTRRNVYIRDDYKCQYCGDSFSHDELTLDHVIPKSKGGRLGWTNTVAACGPCNVKKGNKIVKPKSTPYRPTWHEINNNSKYYPLSIPDPSWQDFINWPEDQLKIVPLNI
mgnify:CR=1 FL=1